MSSQVTPVVTCTIYRDDKFLVIRRPDSAKKFGGSWGFPGGKIEPGETAIGALRREIAEETGLEISDELLFIDSYYYGDSLGLHFAAFSATDTVITEPDVQHKWLASLDELKKLPRIPGIDFHILQAERLRQQKDTYLSCRKLDYTPDKYTN